MRVAIVRLMFVVLVITWSGTAVAQEQLYGFVGDSNGDDFGFSVGGGYDLDGEGSDDVIVGARRDDNNGTSSGSARTFVGATGIAHCTVNGALGDGLGTSVGVAPDLDGDGGADIVAGSPYSDAPAGAAGSLVFYSGDDCAVLDTVTGDAAKDHLGTAVAYAGDVNNHGSPDVIVGAPEDDFFDPGNGYARVISGTTRAVIYTFSGAAVSDRFGTSVAGAGDVDGDGYDDVIVGAPRSGTGGQSGYAVVYSGRTGAQLYALSGSVAGDQFGTSVTGVGDVNSDGHDDFAVGAPYEDIPPNQDNGRVRVYSGATGAVLYDHTGQPGVHFGYSLAGLGDVDKDGVPDFAVGAPLFFGPPFGAGAKAVYNFGATVFSGATGAALYSVTGTNPDDALGFSVGAAGDVNGDGSADLIAGAWQFSTPGPGYARVYALACTDNDGDGYGNPGLATC
ncbi:MAG: FG-GAP repeat protein, partial [Myxococcales bacterium]|nr:FG-GAP repeat protein [Myxococcales bacterium]